MNKKIIAIAVATAFSLGVGLPAQAKEKMVQCYGIAKAGKNLCGTTTHSCAGQAKTDCDPSEWILVKKGACEKQTCKDSSGNIIKGSLMPGGTQSKDTKKTS